MSEIIPHQQTLPEVPAPSVATPAQLLEIAVRQDADIDKLERLMVLQERWETNEARKAFVAARSKLREELPTIAKDGSVSLDRGKTVAYTHATLAGAMRQIRPALTAHGFDVSWRTSVGEGNAIIVTCILTHSGGHSEDTAMVALPDTSGAKNAIQAQGSTVTYLERYTLFALLGLASGEDDDDGMAAAEPAVDERTQQILLGMQTAAEGGVLNEWYAKLEVDDRERISLPAYNRARLVNKEAQLAKAEESSDG